jgi:hypothetical protein
MSGHQCLCPRYNCLLFVPVSGEAYRGLALVDKTIEGHGWWYWALKRFSGLRSAAGRQGGLRAAPAPPNWPVRSCHIARSSGAYEQRRRAQRGPKLTAGERAAPCHPAIAFGAYLDGFVQLHKDHYGRGPEKAKTYFQDDLVVVLMRGGFTKVRKPCCKTVAANRCSSSGDTSKRPCGLALRK